MRKPATFFLLVLVLAVLATSCIRYVGKSITPLADGQCIAFDAKAQGAWWPGDADFVPPLFVRITVEGNGQRLRVNRVPATCATSPEGFIAWNEDDVGTFVRPAGAWRLERRARGARPTTTVTEPDGAQYVVAFAEPGYEDSRALSVLKDGRLWFEAGGDVVAIVDLSTGLAWAFALPDDRLKALSAGEERTLRGKPIDVAVEDSTHP